jgi:predicted amidohydrolase
MRTNGTAPMMIDAALVQIRVDADEAVAARRERAADLVRSLSDADLVVLPELWPTGAFAYDLFADEAESPADGPGGGELFNTALLFSPDGALAATYRKIHRFGFDRGEATMMAAGHEPVTVAHPSAVLGLATCYDLRFPELFRRLVDDGAQALVVSAGWPERRADHWRLLARARAVEDQAYVLACGTAGTHAGVPQAGCSMVVDPWGEVLAEADGNEEQVVRARIDAAEVARVREVFPALKDRVL